MISGAETPTSAPCILRLRCNEGLSAGKMAILPNRKHWHVDASNPGNRLLERNKPGRDLPPRVGRFVFHGEQVVSVASFELPSIAHDRNNAGQRRRSSLRK